MLEAAVNAAIASCLSSSSSSAASRETRRERKAVARLLMPVVLRTEMYRRWKQRVKAGRQGSVGADEEGRGEGDSKRREGELPVEDEVLLMREVMQEDAEMRLWKDEEKHALIRFLLFKARESEQRQQEAAGAGAGAAAAATGAAEEERMTLDELMEASMILYHALMDCNHKLAQLQANSFPPLLPPSTPAPPSSASFASSSSLSPLPPSASAASSSALSAPASAAVPASGRELHSYRQQHELDVEENRRLRAALAQYQQLLASPSSPCAAPFPPLSSLLASSMTSMSSLLSLLQLLYMSACILSWGWQRARREAAGELDRRRARASGDAAGLQEDGRHSIGSGGWWSSWLSWLLSFLP